MQTLLQDLRYGIRMLLKNVGFTAVVVVTLALGIGANTAIFSVIDAVLLRPLPYQDPGRLAVLWTDDPKHNIHEEGTSYLNFLDWKAQSQVFQDMAYCSRSDPVNLMGVEEPERIVGAAVSANFFRLLGVRPFLGRGFTQEEMDRSEAVVVLSYELWQRRFGASLDAIGKVLEMDGRNSRVIGVTPKGFHFPTRNTDLWEPLTAFPRWRFVVSERYSDFGLVVGRLKPNVTFTQARAEMTTIGHRLERMYSNPADPDWADFAGFGVNVVPLGIQITGRETRAALWVLFGAVIFVLLIACANVANLLLARGTGRKREFAVRMALGAGRPRLIRQLLTESAVLSLLSLLLGLLLATAGVRALLALGPRNIARLEQVGIDTSVFAFTVCLSLLAGTLFALPPALKVSRSDPREFLNSGGRSLSAGFAGQRARSLLVVAEFSLSVALLTGAGLLIRSLQRVQAVDPGFLTDHVLTMRIELPPAKGGSQAIAFYQGLIERIQGLLGVRAAGAIDDLFVTRNPDHVITIEGRGATGGEGGEQLIANDISPGYFRAIGVPLLRGRLFSDQDLEKERNSPLVVIINETMSRRFWPGEDPVGRRFKPGGPRSEAPWRTVVGVAGDMHRQGLEKKPISEIFYPAFRRGMDLVVRTTSDPLLLASTVRAEIRSEDKTAAVLKVAPLEQRLGETVSQRRFETGLLGLFSAVALVLTGIGIYGLMHYSVAHRTHEIAIRMALGAQARDVLGMVLRQGLQLALMGLMAGFILMLWLTETISSMLYGITPADPVTLLAVSSLLIIVALLASYFPARRAAKIDPMAGLQYE